ncbi:hypothetical protein Btru_066847 [Bulinus truncatus]|nr:hypothetical protein Btru_066847 [Bulinus truncatus]
MFSCSKQVVLCSVPNNDVNSMVTLNVSVDNPDDLNIEYNITQLNATILLTASREGRYKLICSAKDNHNRNEARAFDNGFNCTCTAYFTSSCNPSNEVRRQIIVPYGPSNLNVTDEDETINLLKCSVKEIQCIVPQNDFYPGVDINCNTDSQEMMSITKKNISNTQGTATFEIYAWKVGSARLICRAVNTENSNLYVESVKNVTLQERYTPQIETNPELPQVEGEISISITINCSLTGHIKRKNITMACFGITNSSTNNSVVISRDLVSSDYNTVCRCTAYYDESSCFEETELNIEVLFVPKMLYTKYDKTIERCQTKIVSVEAKKNDFYPGLRFEFTSDNRSIYLNQSTSMPKSYTDYIKQIISYRALLAGTYTIKCTAYNTKMNEIRTVKTIQVTVLEPVFKETILTFNGGKGFTDRDSLKNTNINCTASDQRTFSSLSLNCLNEQITSSNRTITMNRDLTSNVEENYCHCNAEYFDSCFGHTESAVHINLQCSKPQIIVNNGNPIVVEATYKMHSITCGELEDNKLASTITLECLGESVSSVGTNLTVYRNVSIDSQGASCVCIIDSPYCLQNRTNEIKIDVQYHLGIVNYNANGLNHTSELREGEKVVFTCLVDSNPAPNITLTADDNDFINELNMSQQTLYEKDSTHWIQELTLDSVKCQDTNNYTCTAINNVTNTTYTDSIQILVECPLHVYKKGNTLRHFIGYIDEAAILWIKIYGYPIPNKIILVNSNTKEVVEEDLYEVNYKETKKPTIIVELLIYRLTEDNFTLYTVNISNGIGENLTLEFKRDQESSNAEATNLKIGLGIPLGIALLVIFCCIGIKKCAKRKINCNDGCKGNGETNSNRREDSQSFPNEETTILTVLDQATTYNSQGYTGNGETNSNRREGLASNLDEFGSILDTFENSQEEDETSPMEPYRQRDSHYELQDEVNERIQGSTAIPETQSKVQAKSNWTKQSQIHHKRIIWKGFFFFFNITNAS